MSEGAHRQAAATDGDTTASRGRAPALGAAVGGIASGCGPVGNAAGNLLTSWPNPTSVLVGALGVGTSAYLAAVYMAADARRKRAPSQEDDLCSRALWAGVVAGSVRPASRSHPASVGGGWKLSDAQYAACCRADAVVRAHRFDGGRSASVAAACVLTTALPVPARPAVRIAVQWVSAMSMAVMTDLGGSIHDRDHGRRPVDVPRASGQRLGADAQHAGAEPAARDRPGHLA